MVQEEAAARSEFDPVRAAPPPTGAPLIGAPLGWREDQTNKTTTEAADKTTTKAAEEIERQRCRMDTSLLEDIYVDVRRLLRRGMVETTDWSTENGYASLRDAVGVTPVQPKVRWGRVLGKGTRDLLGAVAGTGAAYLLAQAGNQEFLDWANEVVDQYPAVGIAVLALQPIAGIAAVRALQDRYQRTRS